MLNVHWRRCCWCGRRSGGARAVKHVEQCYGRTSLKYPQLLLCMARCKASPIFHMRLRTYLHKLGQHRSAQVPVCVLRMVRTSRVALVKCFRATHVARTCGEMIQSWRWSPCAWHALAKGFNGQ